MTKSGVNKKRVRYMEWTAKQIRALEEAEFHFRAETNEKWIKVAESVPERTAKECR